jgi:hypothetical protein
MGKQLGELRGFDDVPLCVSERIIPKSLHDLGNVEKGDVDRVTFQSSYSILQHERVIAILGQKERHSRDGVDRGPVEEVLQRLASGLISGHRHSTYLELEAHVLWKLAAEEDRKSFGLCHSLRRTV